MQLQRPAGRRIAGKPGSGEEMGGAGRAACLRGREVMDVWRRFGSQQLGEGITSYAAVPPRHATPRYARPRHALHLSSFEEVSLSVARHR